MKMQITSELTLDLIHGDVVDINAFNKQSWTETSVAYLQQRAAKRLSPEMTDNLDQYIIHVCSHSNYSSCIIVCNYEFEKSLKCVFDMHILLFFYK